MNRPGNGKALRKTDLKTIVVPTDFSQESGKALEYGRALSHAFDAEVHLVHAHERDFSYGLPIMVSAAAEAAGKAIETTLHARLAETARKHGWPEAAERRHVRIGRAYEAICAVAQKTAADLIVIGTHGYGGWRRLVLGSTAERVVQNAPCPVLVVRERERDFLQPATAETETRAVEVKRILAPVDFSECSRKGLHYAIDFAARTGARLTLLHTIQVMPMIPADDLAEVTQKPSPGAVERAAKKEMNNLVKETDFGGIKHDAEVRAGQVGFEICRFAEQHDIDLIVSSTHGASGLEGVLIGSTAERVVRYAPCPVLVVPARWKAKR